MSKCKLTINELKKLASKYNLSVKKESDSYVFFNKKNGVCIHLNIRLDCSIEYVEGLLKDRLFGIPLNVVLDSSHVRDTLLKGMLK